jgi:prepilin signal peptidase PulO-like enzyme (type II secretory pathway)
VKLAAAMGAWLGPQDGLIAVAVACAATACTMRLAAGSAQSARTTSAPTVAPLGIALSAALVLTVGFRLWVAP